MLTKQMYLNNSKLLQMDVNNGFWDKNNDTVFIHVAMSMVI